MRIAFYAPLKPPDHRVPSGDRQIARAILRALAYAGHDAVVATRLRSFDRSGDDVRQARLARLGERIAQRLIARWRDGPRPDAWLTYHLYHKAPDAIGPVVTAALGMPYVVVEASISPSQCAGPWARGHAATVAAARAADAIVCLNPRDVPQIRATRGAKAATTLIAPFIDVAAFAAAAPTVRATHLSAAPPALVTVAMMRDGAKLASYRALASALGTLVDLDWSLRIVGDGPQRSAVEHAFAGLAPRVSFIGACAAPAIAGVLCDSDLLVWPAIDEAIGLALIEAQACGVPVVAGDSAGVAAVVDAGRTGLLAREGDVPAFAAAMRVLLVDAPRRARMGAAAAAYVRARHDIPTAAAALDGVLRSVVARTRVIAASVIG